CPVSSRKEQAQEEDEQRPPDAEEQVATVGRFRLVARHVQQILPRPVAAHAGGSNSPIPSAFARQPRPRSVQSKCQLALSVNPSPRIVSPPLSPAAIRNRVSRQSHPRRGDEGDQARYGHAQAYQADPAPTRPVPAPRPTVGAQRPADEVG